MWSSPGNMPKYYPSLRDIEGRVKCLSDLGNILAYYLDKTTFPGNMPKYYPGNMSKYYSTKYHYRNLHEV